MGEVILVLTIGRSSEKPYQGIVALRENNLAASLQNYFNDSEQLSIRFWLFADKNKAVGLLLQELPGKNENLNDWQRVELLADTVIEREMMVLSCQEMLGRLFHENRIRLFETEFVEFGCR